MRSAWPWFVVAAALAGGAWLLLRGGGGEETPDMVGGIDRAPVEPSEPEGPGVRLEGTEPTRTEAPRPRRYPPQVPLSQLPRGEILAKVVDEAGAPVPTSEIRLVLEEVDRPIWPSATAMTEPEAGIWRFTKVPVGRVRLHASGDHVLDAAETVEVTKDQVVETTVTLKRAGAVSYVAALYTGEVPERVTLSLRDEKGKAVPAWWQVRTTTVLTEPRRAAEVVLGGEGIAYGVPPGRYRLRGTSPGDDVDEQEVVVEAGKTASVKLSFRE